MREIVNVQLGTYANHVGAHFWNLQDEYLALPPPQRLLSPSVLFCESSRGASARIPLYSPRLQVVDLAGAFGSLSLDAGTVLAEPPGDPSAAAWAGASQTYRQERAAPSAYVAHLLAEDVARADAAAGGGQEGSGGGGGGGGGSDAAMGEEEGAEPDFGLDAGVASWGDFLKARLHPRTCAALRGLHAGVAPFDKFDHGRAAASGLALDDLFDGLRFFAEECDSLGGVHVVAGASDGFAGLAAPYLARMRDELGAGTPLLVVGAAPQVPAARAPPAELALRDRDRCAAEARLVAACVDVAAQYAPADAAAAAALRYVHPRPANDYHSSAVIALGLDVALTPVRFAPAGVSSGGLVSMLRPAPFAVLSSLFTKFPVVEHPAAAVEKGYFFKRTSFTNLSMRAFPAQIAAQRRGRPASLPSTNVCEVVSARGAGPATGIFASVSNKVALPVAYPRFFESCISLQGDLRIGKKVEDEAVTRNCEVAELKCIAGFATSALEGSELLGNFAAVLSEVSKKTSSRHTLETSSFQEIQETLSGLGQDYNTL